MARSCACKFDASYSIPSKATRLLTFIKKLLSLQF
ncbi:uncharacterized protein G2W53_027220 [Senna tora]|uniref:Uncharacterized protein n=1 Tax=Senna tora TaxID=362788 RepID=A0A834WFV1_9FABA|nr:uncharacterized protein G2W53_027220 [Senna tora]